MLINSPEGERGSMRMEIWKWWRIGELQDIEAIVDYMCLEVTSPWPGGDDCVPTFPL